MSNKRSKIVGFTKLTNKTNRNAFDKTHRNMFTAQIGELLPVFCEWMNPSETIKLGYTGFTRTASLQTAAFTRLRENIQYFFVPFSALWKYFDGNMNNMTLGANGQKISRVASSATDSQTLGTGMPFYNYSSLGGVLRTWFEETWTAIAKWLANQQQLDDSGNAIGPLTKFSQCNWTFLRPRLIQWLSNESYPWQADLPSPVSFSGVEYIRNGTYRYTSIAKLLMALGYGNFSFYLTYDIISSLIAWSADAGKDENPTNKAWIDKIRVDKTYGWYIAWNYFDIENSPNLSVFPLLAYHKIIEDFYKNREWQGYSSWTCNIDYLKPTDSMDMSSKIAFTYPANTDYNGEESFFDMGYSNLPLDYLLGVLPRAQYGDEEAVSTTASVTTPSSSATTSSSSWTGSTVARTSAGGNLPTAVTDGMALVMGDKAVSAGNKRYIDVQNAGGTSVGSELQLYTQHSHTLSVPSMTATANSEFKISALRSALAVQKYKEIQNSNDSDFAEQVLAHFGIKPQQTNTINSRFITGADATISINPQVNSNLTDGAQTDIKAIATSQLQCSGSFTADTYGVLIGIYRCVPTLDYAKLGIDRNLYKTDATDFPIPELDSIGMQTQYRSEIYSPDHAFAVSDFDALDFVRQIGASFSRVEDMSATYGYLPRYAELKTSYDRYSGAFLSSLKSWVTGLNVSDCRKWFFATSQMDSTKDWTIEKLFRVNPHLCDSIFVNQNALTVDDDKLMIGSVNNVQIVRPFSTYGLPWSN